MLVGPRPWHFGLISPTEAQSPPEQETSFSSSFVPPLNEWTSEPSTAPSNKSLICSYFTQDVSGQSWPESISTVHVADGNAQGCAPWWTCYYSVAKSCPTLCGPMDCSQASLSFSVFWGLLKLMSIELVMPSSHLILCHPLLLLPSVFLSIRVFSNESALPIRWSKHWSFSFSISPSNEYSGLISFWIDLFDLLLFIRLLRVFFITPVWKHQFFSTHPSLWSNSHIHTWLLEKS